MILFTFISHGRGECGAWHVGKMAAQCKISRDEFHELIDCPMSEAEYIGVPMPIHSEANHST